MTPGTTSSSRTPLLARAIRRLLGSPAESLAPPPAGYMPVVGVVRDPMTPMQLVSISGLITPLSLRTVQATLDDIPSRSSLHLDLTDAIVSDQLVLRATEALIESLECRGVRVRIVGLDPAMPALAAHWRS